MNQKRLLISCVYFVFSTQVSQALASKKNESSVPKNKIEVSLEKHPQPILNLFLYQDSPDKKINSLSQLKLFEIQKKWKSCLELSPSLAKKEKNISGWVYQTWMNCALKNFEGSESSKSKKNNSANTESALAQKVEPLRQVVASLSGQIQLLDRGPWKSQLTAFWVKSLQILIDKDPSRAQSYYEMALLRPEFLNSDLRNLWLEKLQDSVPASPNKTIKNANFVDSSLDRESEEHKKLDQVWWQKKRDFSIEPYVDFINAYPGGKFAKLWKDRLLEVYGYFWDQKKDEASHILKHMLKLEPNKLLEISLSLHRKADFEGSLKTADEVLKKGLQTSQVYWVAGRSALMSGHYEESKNYFQKIVDFYSGSDEFLEALFRLGLLHYRLGNPQQAVSYFTKLMATQKDKFDLNTRYWYVRSLQDLKSDLFLSARDQLILDYPFSYYGLKLLAEKNEQKIEFPPDNSNDSKAFDYVKKIVLVGDAAQNYQRGIYLQKNGWLIEAGFEFSEMFWTANSQYQLLAAQKMAELKQWIPAIRLANQAFEQNQNLKNWELMSLFFPQDYSDLIATEAEKRKIHPRLVKSLIRQESAFGLRATSTSNAMGLMQMIPPTAQDIARQLKMNIQLPDDMYSPVNNIPMGVFYISQMVDEFKGHIPLALAAYNAGPSKIKLWMAARSDAAKIMTQFSTEPRDEIWFEELPTNETSFYVKAILRNILLYQLVEEKKVTIKPAFWADLSLKNSKTP